MARGILMAVAQWERMRWADSTRIGMQGKRARGEYTGGKPPLGWKVDGAGDEVPDEDEQELIRIVRDLKGLRMSYQTIADILSSTKYTSRTGSQKFSKSTVHRLNFAETTEERRARIETLPIT